MTAPAEPPIGEQIDGQRNLIAKLVYPDALRMAKAILASLEAHKRITEAAGRPEPVARYRHSGDRMTNSDGTEALFLCNSLEYVWATDYDNLLAYADRVVAERGAANDEIVRLNKWADSFTDSHLKERKTGDALVKEVLRRAETAERQLAELQRKYNDLLNSRS